MTSSRSFFMHRAGSNETKWTIAHDFKNNLCTNEGKNCFKLNWNVVEAGRFWAEKWCNILSNDLPTILNLILLMIMKVLCAQKEPIDSGIFLHSAFHFYWFGFFFSVENTVHSIFDCLSKFYYHFISENVSVVDGIRISSVKLDFSSFPQILLILLFMEMNRLAHLISICMYCLCVILFLFQLYEKKKN